MPDGGESDAGARPENLMSAHRDRIWAEEGVIFVQNFDSKLFLFFRRAESKNFCLHFLSVGIFPWL